MAENYIISQEEAGELRKAVRQAMTLLQYVGERLGQQSPQQELASDYAKELGTRPVFSVRGLRSKIKDILKSSGTPKRSVDIADALYTRNMGISRDRFARRVIVNISAMYKEGTHGIEKVTMDGREALWRIVFADIHGTEFNEPLQSSSDSPKPNTITAPSKANIPS